MIEVLLIPPYIHPVFGNKSFMPLGLLAISANLQKSGYFPSIYQPKKRKHLIDFIEISKDILKKSPQIIGFSTWCISFASSLIIARQIKKEVPDKLIVFGGPQASILARETLIQFPFVDFVLAGEADYSFPSLINELTKKLPDLKQIPGLTYRGKSGKILQNPVGGVIDNLDNLPIPAYNLISNNKTLKLDVGRGCPFKCAFCTTNDFFSKKYRVKTVSRIIHEMNFAFKTFKIRKFSFAHDLFTLNKKFIFDLCNTLVHQKKVTGISYTWTCSARIDCVSKEMLIQMQEAGCESIFFGVESGSEKIQKSIGKNLQIEKVYEVANACREAGLIMHTSFIIGFPDETKKDLEKSLKCAFQMALKGALVQFSELTFLPGTPLFEKYKNELKFDGTFSSFSNIICTQDEKKLITEYPQIFSSFYFLPVKTLTHDEMTYLSNLINNMNYFRNTLFLLRVNLEHDVKGKNLFKLFKNKFKTFSADDLSDTLVLSHWIRFLKTYISENKNCISNPFLTDVFAFESFAALLTALYSFRQLIQPGTKNQKLHHNFIIKPTPIWKLLTVKYKLESILPSENKWEENPKKFRKGRYNYLLVGVSESKCNKIRINDREFFLFKNLSELSFLDFVKKTNSVSDEKSTSLWLKKLRRLGVVEFSEIA